MPVGDRRSAVARHLGKTALRASARLRRAVPAPTGRTGRRSAFPCLRAVMRVGDRPFLGRVAEEVVHQEV